MTKEETYEIEVRCDNCKKESKIKIKKGISISQLKGFWNDDCGCKFLKSNGGDCY